MAVKEETPITQDCIAWIKDQGGDAWHVHGSALQRSGEPDICGEIPDGVGGWLHLKIEVKTPTGKPSKLQEYRLAQYAKAGYVTGIVTSVDELKTVVEAALKPK